jgi:hypothetical protein
MNPVLAFQSAHGFNCSVCRERRLIADTVEVFGVAGFRRLLADGADGGPTSTTLTEEYAVDPNGKAPSVWLTHHTRKAFTRGSESLRGLRSPPQLRLRFTPAPSERSRQQSRGSSGGKRASVEGSRLERTRGSLFPHLSQRHLPAIAADRERDSRRGGTRSAKSSRARGGGDGRRSPRPFDRNASPVRLSTQ